MRFRVLESQKMPGKPTLYIDIDDTIITQVLPGSGFDLRPCVMTHLRVLSRMYDCCWPTMWPYTEPKRPRSCHDRMSIVTMMRCLYGTQVNDGGLPLACLALRRQRVALGCGLQQVVLQHQICNQSLQSRVLVAQMPEFFCFN